ncbi:hypothetical protein GCM10010306_092030 [Streptomyces umbrinus]|uniref:Zn-ribbon domain-containing OB-fold protein n=1 Tax=Streptomyces umbrinus TaxID=67370 RepID=UPI0016718C39|nr:OB-fold domain-containing protein [Streptomyces umbrinus]GHB83050.1 hypothetical protein GCM10010306_092030 [Streptomyces umbrinus]
MPKPLRKALPKPTPETQPFWDAAAQGELRIQRCVTTGKFFFHPRPCSPYVLDGEVEWVTVSGDATLYSYNINHRPAPGFEDEAPYAIAVVELAEGPRMMTNIVGIDNTPENLVLDMPLKVRFQERDGIVVPVFAPAEVAA